MKRTLVLMATLLVSLSAQAYQVTGPVLEVTDSKIVVEKDKEKWEMARDAATRTSAAVKVGDKVTVEYKMTAVKITVK
jgi:predicted tellurium resistance membrane protein TerC